MRKARRKASAVFEKICVQLIFLLSAFLLLFLGIRAAGKTIEIARAEKIEIINNLVEGLSEGSNLKRQSKKLQNTLYQYLEAFIRAVANFEFVPRNDFTVLPQIINSMPQETEIVSFLYHGRSLSIQTVQTGPDSEVEMAGNLERRILQQGEFEKVVYSYYIDNEGSCIAQITLVAHHYDERDLESEMTKQFFPKKIKSGTGE